MKKKTFVLVGIAICTILLTSPVLASAGYSKIYGNANEDDTLDMRDVTYIKLVIFGKKPATTFADANYDGKISMLDIGQTKLIILDREKQLTLVDQADLTVTVPRPIERVVSTFPSLTRLTVELGGIDKLVGVSSYMTTIFSPTCPESKMIVLWAYPELKELPGVGGRSNPNFEQIVKLKPDAVFVATYGGSVPASQIQELTGVPSISASGSYPYEGKGGLFDGYRVIGKIIGNEERAEELISFYNEEYDKVRAMTSEIPVDERVRVLWCSGITRPSKTRPGIIEAGGINVASGCPDREVSKEQVIKWNPDIILIHALRCDTEKIGILLNDPVLQSVNAVNNGTVYCTKGGWYGTSPATGVTELPYMAKLFYPDKFKDLDVEKEGNRILKKFYGVDGMYTFMQESCDLYKWE
jgi:iron complex transport system substrate-binding protein